MTYKQLEELISQTNQMEMRIVDFGASHDLSQYSRSGNSCVAQSIAFAAHPYLRGKKKTLDQVLLDPGKYQNLYSDIGVPLGLIRTKIQRRGAALDQITAMLNPVGADTTLSIALWTPSTPNGRLESGNQPMGPAHVNLVIQDYHAMVALPAAALTQIPEERFRVPQDCRHECWN